MNAIELVELLARSTWATVDRTHRNGIALGEDAITSINLDVLVTSKVGLLVEDTRIHEAIKGCDFELWVGIVSYSKDRLSPLHSAGREHPGNGPGASSRSNRTRDGSAS